MFSTWDEYHLINDELAGLAQEMPEFDLGEVIRYALSSPGKRVRPLILLFSSEAFGGSAETAMKAALAVELVHAASLVHDDILDYGLERRGGASTLGRFGRDSALLAGDFLISKSIDLISSYGQKVICTFARACMSMSEGEMMDISLNISPESYNRCIFLKTATLFAASARIGCLIAGADERDAAGFESYGTHLGLAYQILDDLEEHLGIDQGKKSGKKSLTLPGIYELDHSPEAAVEMCVQVIKGECSSAKMALASTSGDSEMKCRLAEIIDQMTAKGLNRCRLQRSLC